MDLPLFVNQLRASMINSGQLVHAEELFRRDALYAGLAHELHLTLTSALAEAAQGAYRSVPARSVGGGGELT